MTRAALQESQADGVNRGYARHLRKKFRTAVIVTLAAAAALCLAAFDLWTFSRGGASVLHPALGIFIIAAALSLMITASISIFAVTRYRRRVAGKSQ